MMNSTYHPALPRIRFWGFEAVRTLLLFGWRRGWLI